MKSLAATVCWIVCGAFAGAVPGSCATEILGLDRIDRVPERFIVVLKRSQSEALTAEQSLAEVSTFAAELAKDGDMSLVASLSHALQAVVVKTTIEAAQRLAKDPRVAYVETDALVRSQSVVSETATQNSPGWGLDRIDQNLPPLDDRYSFPITAGSGVHAYVLDTAIATNHPEFTGRVGNGVSFVSEDGGTQPPYPGHPVPQTVDTTCFDHGTGVASILLGSQSGVAKMATLHPVRVTGCQDFSLISTLLLGVDWVKANHLRPAVANIGAGGPSSQVLRDAVASLVAAGVVVVVPAGNDSDDACKYSPANAPQALTVAASVRVDDSLASFSNFGNCVDLKAPGMYVAVANAAEASGGGGGTSGLQRSGTSFASPYVAGAAALLLSKYPSATPAEVANTLLANVSQSGVLRTDFLLSREVPGAPVSLTLQSTGCYGENLVTWNEVLGAGRYEVWASARSSFANPWLQGNFTTNQSIVDFPSIAYVRVRACNPWGCGAFSPTKTSKLATTCG